MLARVRGSRLLVHAPAFIVLWLVLSQLNNVLDPLYSYYLALVAMYATAMLGMVILVGLSGQVSLGNGALMAVGGYVFAITSLNWKTVPFLGLPWNAVWSMVFAALGGVVVGLIIGLLGARLQGPYLAGLTLGIAVGVPAIANRFPELLGGSQGFKLTVPYPEGGYPDEEVLAESVAETDESALDEALGITTSAEPSAVPEESLGSEDLLSLDDVEGGASAVPEESLGSEDLLSLDDVEGGASANPVESAGGEDLLTLDDVEGGASANPEASAVPEASPFPDASAFPEASAAAGTGGTGASELDPTATTGFVLEQWQASVAIAVACIAGFVALNLVRGRQGQMWRAVRDDPVAAALVGIPPAATKVSAFVVSSVFAALAGAVFAQILTYVGPGAYGVGLSLSLLVGVILGGRASLVGAVIGAVLIVGLPEVVARLAGDRGWPDQVANNVPNLAYGLLLVLVVLVAPGGVVGTARDWWDGRQRRRAKA